MKRAYLDKLYSKRACVMETIANLGHLRNGCLIDNVEKMSLETRQQCMHAQLAVINDLIDEYIKHHG